MKFGKTELKPEEIDFTLPEMVNLPKFKHRDEPEVYTGQPLWSVRANVGKIYPKGTKAKDFLYHYSRQFNSIELNATYYKIPTIDQVKNWKSQTPPDFKFCPKFPQFISHRKVLSEKTGPLDEFLTHIYHFGDQLGVTFLQLPPHFGPDSIEELKKFVGLWPDDMTFAVEFRHPEWFRNGDAWQSITDHLMEKGIGTVITDTPGRRDVLHMKISSPQVVVRFKGNNLHSSDFSRIDSWADRSLDMLRSGVSQVYFFVHQEDESLGIELAQKYINKINTEMHSGYRAPELMAAQQGLFFQS